MGEPTPTTDNQSAPERLLARYVGGDADAFTELVGLYEEKLFAFIARYTQDAHMAEDVFQQVFIKVAINAATFDGRASFSTWLYRIARNQAIDELRKRRRHPTLGGEDCDPAEMLADPGNAAPLDKMTRDEQAAKMRQALSELPEPQREAFLLKEEADMDFEQIGAIMNCGRETAKSRFRLAVAKLREAFGLR